MSRAHQSRDIASLDAMHRMMDGLATPEEAAAVADRIATDAAYARSYARLCCLHDAIGHQLGAAAASEAARPAAPSPSLAHRVSLHAARWAAAACLGVALIVAGLVVTHSPSAYAQAEIQRVTAAHRALRGSSYRIEVQGEAPAGQRTKPSLQGAILHVGEDGRYVLFRQDDRGVPMVTGSDGQVAWSMHGRGPVRVSVDPSRFRGAVPGQQHDLPFVDPIDGFARLASAYELTISEPPEVPTGSVWQGRTIVGQRRATVARGPRTIAMEFDPDTAIVYRMHMNHLPQAGGGPTSVTLYRLADEPKPLSFFSHQSHHEPGRRVVSDDKVLHP